MVIVCLFCLLPLRSMLWNHSNTGSLLMQLLWYSSLVLKEVSMAPFADTKGQSAATIKESRQCD